MLLLATLDDKIDHIKAFAATPTTTAIVNRILLLAVSFLSDILPFPIAEYDYVLRQCFLLVAFNINVILIATRFYTLRSPILIDCLVSCVFTFQKMSTLLFRKFSVYKTNGHE